MKRLAANASALRLTQYHFKVAMLSPQLVVWDAAIACHRKFTNANMSSSTTG